MPLVGGLSLNIPFIGTGWLTQSTVGDRDSSAVGRFFGKIKTKITDKNHKKDKGAITVARTDETTASPRRGRIINARRYAIKPMSDEEAVMMLDDGADSFLVFRNSANQRVSVIYKRKDGNYGLIQP